MPEPGDIVLNELTDPKLVHQMHDDLYDGLKDEIVEGVMVLLGRGWAPYKVLTEALVEGMRIVGEDFRDGILFVPEVLLSANAMKAGMALYGTEGWCLDRFCCRGNRCWTCRLFAGLLPV